MAPLSGDERVLAGTLTVGLLGPLEVSVAGRPVELSSGRMRTLLALLAISAGRPVSVDRLATALWDELPDRARRAVQTHLNRLRGALGAGLIDTVPAGYVLHADPDHVDALRFARLLDAAAQATDPAAERVRLDEALMLWRGTPFDGVRSDWLEHTEAPRLTERYLAAVERRIDLDLADGRHTELTAKLRELTGEHPLREPLWVRLLVVLDRCGRRAEALERYETIRRYLADELGTDPGPELQQTHANLLTGTTPPRSEPIRASRLVVPRQLPADIDGFTGRDPALKALNDLISERDERTVKAVVISAIEGTAGVGKTALALHWAHRVADRFPDGQLHVNLRGFHPAGQAMAPAEAVRGFLDALGVAPHHVPSDLDAQAALYRSLLAGKRMLVLLDNAREAEQVRPLLPGSPGCLVIVTSRNQLTSLVATVGARPLQLDLLPIDEARQLLAYRLGADRIAAESDAADEIVSRCERLPLALAVAAARAATHPDFPLATIAAELRDDRTGLDAFSAGDPITDARAVFSWSYQALTPNAARLFRLLGLHPGPDVTAPAAASLAALPVPRVRQLLAELTRAHLLTEHVPGRYTLHDLLRVYATELAHTHDLDTEPRAALHRILDHYLHTGHTAALSINSHRDPITVTPPQPGVTPEDFTDHEQAQAWFTIEHPVLLLAIQQAGGAGFDTHAGQIAWTVAEFLYRRGDWPDLTTTQHTALDAARRLGDRAGQALAHRTLGYAYSHLGRHQEAHTHLEQALDLYRQLGDRIGQAHVHHGLSLLFEWQDRRAEALTQAEHALELYRLAGHRVGQARALNAIGWDHAHLGNYQSALACCQQALTLHQETGNRAGEAATWDSLGYTHHHLGHHRDATASYREAINLYRDLDDRYSEADTLTRLGDTHAEAGNRDAARAAWRQALTIFDELDHPDADRVREKLARPGERDRDAYVD